MIPIAIRGREQLKSIPDIFDDLNYSSYATQREQGMSAERAQAFYLRHLGGLTQADVERWERRYQEEQR